MSTLPGINFVDAQVKAETDALVQLYAQYGGSALAPGDPRRMLFNVIAERLVHQQVLINLAARSVLLRYASGDALDALGEFAGVSRLPAESARTTLLFTLSTPLTSATVIPSGTRVAPEGGDGELYFETTSFLQIPAGSTTGTVAAEAQTGGVLANGFFPGQLTTLMDPIPFVQSVSNTTETTGGSEEESDDALRERIRMAPESFSVAGPAGAYEFWAKTASAAIIDVSVTSPADMEVLVVPLLRGGIIPSQDVLDAVAAVLNDSEVRPMTDKVTVYAPTETTYNVDYTYYIPNSRASETVAIQAAVSQATDDYVLWQKSRLGRDIDPSELNARVRNAGGIQIAIREPVLTDVDLTEIAQEGTVTAVFGGLING